MLLEVLLLWSVTIGSFVLVAVMAKNRNRDPVTWVLLSLIGTPILMCFILLIAGKYKEDKNRYYV